MKLRNGFELMQDLFVNVDKNTGATIISAAGGTQFALEKGSLENGVFTYSILECMQQREHATVSELKIRQPACAGTDGWFATTNGKRRKY